jgi:hypothetical protein
MKIHDVQQGSLEWQQLRLGIPTASEFDNLVTPEWKVRTGDMPKTYLAKKVAEAWLGLPIGDAFTWEMEQGTLLESRAIPWFELEYDVAIQQVGFITTDDGRIGCSPDGLLTNSGLEVKCPAIHTHVRYVLAGDVPKDYRAQVQGSMLVTGFPTWNFLSYRRGVPPLVVAVQAEDKAQKALHEALTAFLEQFDAALAKLVRMNGGVMPERPKLSPPEAEPQPEYLN